MKKRCYDDEMLMMMCDEEMMRWDWRWIMGCWFLLWRGLFVFHHLRSFVAFAKRECDDPVYSSNIIDLCHPSSNKHCICGRRSHSGTWLVPCSVQHWYWQKCADCDVKLENVAKCWLHLTTWQCVHGELGCKALLIVWSYYLRASN